MIATFGSGCDNFISIRAINFFKPSFHFYNIGCISISVYLICETEYLSLFVDKMNIPPRRGRNRPRRALPVDEEATSTPYTPPPQEKSQVQPEFQVLPIPQPSFFPPMILETFQAYMNF